MSFRNLLDKRVTKEIEFLGDTVTVRKMSYIELKEFQKFAQDLNRKEKDEEARSRKFQHDLIRRSVEGGEDVTVEELGHFPPTDLAELGRQILEFNGLKMGETEDEAEEGNAGD